MTAEQAIVAIQRAAMTLIPADTLYAAVQADGVAVSWRNGKVLRNAARRGEMKAIGAVLRGLAHRDHEKYVEPALALLAHPALAADAAKALAYSESDRARSALG